MATFTNTQIQQMNPLPLVTIPSYSDQDIDAEYALNKERHKLDVQEWFRTSYLFMLVLSVIGSILVYVLFSSMLKTNDPQLNLILADLRNYLPLITLGTFAFSALSGLALCPIPNWYSAPGRDAAEFNLRAKLTADQRVDASEEKMHQIFAYCNSALNRPYTEKDFR
jgi:hypothetical protein